MMALSSQQQSQLLQANVVYSSTTGLNTGGDSGVARNIGSNTNVAAAAASPTIRCPLRLPEQALICERLTIPNNSDDDDGEPSTTD